MLNSDWLALGANGTSSLNVTQGFQQSSRRGKVRSKRGCLERAETAYAMSGLDEGMLR